MAALTQCGDGDVKVALAWRGAGRARAAACGRAASRARMALSTTGLLVAMAGAFALVAGSGLRLEALKAAGAFKGASIGGVEHFVNALEGNMVWLGGTAMGLIIAVVGILFMAGHSRAHDVALKTVIGLAILASVSGIVA